MFLGTFRRLLVITIVSTIRTAYSTDLSDVSPTVFPGRTPKGAVLGAYGDYNADKLIDIFVITDQGKSLDILLAHENKAYSRESLLNGTVTEDGVITAVVPADFNGDALMDVLITKRNQSGEMIFICWGRDDNHHQTIGTPTPLEQNLVVDDQPTLFDYNQDMLPDLLVSKGSDRLIFLASHSKTFNKTDFPSSTIKQEKLAKPQSNAFVNLNGDYMADLLLTTEQGYEPWFRVGNELELNFTIPLPKDRHNYMVGQVAVADIDQDGLPNLVVPVCKYIEEQKRCTESKIYGLSDLRGNWTVILDTFKFNSDGPEWNFTPPDPSKFPTLPISLRFGDYNGDGFPDILAFLEYHDHENVRKEAFLLQNYACTGTDPGCFLNRTFSADFNTEMRTYDDVILGSFFDLYEDGVLDILLVTLVKSKDKEKSDQEPVLRAIRQTSTTDTTFLKVTVTSGLCYKNCLDGRQPYGVNVPGPVVKFQTVSVNGAEQTSSGTQLSQSAHFALQLPFVLFGLGLTPNFVDEVGVAIPVEDPKTEVALERTWSQIIPNSQLVVIPYPNEEPDRWIVKLFVTPSQSVLITGAALLGTCGFVAGIIGIFHWRERREDMKEKRQESHKFHFDAM